MDRSVQNPLVSIVMPVYNAEKYLEEALRSLLRQEYQKLEILCVDDGSDDRSPEILRKQKKQDPRLRILTQKHQGAGEARNRGMAAARGKYLMFLDADDVFRKDMIRILVRTAEKKDTDILFFQYDKLLGKRKQKADFSAKNLLVPIGKVIAPEEISDRLFQADHGMPWNKFYKTGFVRKTKVSFQALRNTNDEFFSRITEVEARRILFLPNRFVSYRVGNPHSLQGEKKQSILDFTCALKTIHDELCLRGHYDTYYTTYQKLASIMILLRLEEKNDFDTFCTLVKGISRDVLKPCEIDMRFAEKSSRGVFAALQTGDISKAAFALYRMRTKRRSSIRVRIKRKLLKISKRILETGKGRAWE